MQALSRAMEEYEQAIAEHEKDFRDERERTIRKLRELSVESAPPEKTRAEEDSLLIEDMEPLEEESVPIINVGGLEPVFAVREVDEELKLEEIDESIQDETVPIEDERPPNLVNLLKDQELYEENPALQMFEPQPQLSSQQPRGVAGSAGGGREGPAPGGGYGGAGGGGGGYGAGYGGPGGAYAGAGGGPVEGVAVGGGGAGGAGGSGAEGAGSKGSAAQGQPFLSVQGESVLATSLRESVSAQAKVVDKLFDELHELSRKIDEKRQPAPAEQLPPIVLNMQSPGAGSPAAR